ncbi:hypothetical protein MSG28_011388 [Choristoneura fumiferana]|uniref:Uncharacterized protein n=1 Tax=Choristoneura fumiferana TaxID=7141 RepID=A0ACC0JN98_CHOFU|nr:hypothetical protein MSG28_011388 [Choristoneura fumiferana]
MILLKYSLENIKYDIVGLSEIRRKGNEIIEDQNHIFCYTGETQGQYGVGFLIKKKYKNNIENYVGISDRVCLLNMKFDAVSISIIQVYAPTSEARDEEMDIFYDQIDRAQNLAIGKIILMGDLNAKIGQRKHTEKTIMGPYCYGIRNHRGDKLIQYAFTNKFKVINTIFKKKTKNLWTWITPDKQHKNQIDYILSNHSKLFTNIEILNNGIFPSDHRLVRGTIHLHKTRRSRATFSEPRANLSIDKIQQEYLKSLKEKTKYLQWKNSDDIESFYLKLESAVKQSLRAATSKKVNIEIITDETKQQLKKRTLLQAKPSKTKEEKKELATLYKTTNKMLKRDYENYRMKVIEKNLINTGSQKKAYKQLNTEKKWIPALKSQNENGKLQTRNDLINIATDFYRNLYHDEHNEENEYQNYETEHNTPIIPFERKEILEKIKKLKNEKSPGQDNIPNEAIKIGQKILIDPITTLFNKILETQKIPKSWGESQIILLYKKGDPSDINNYRPISLLPTLYKLFSMCLEKRISSSIENSQPIEQAGFRAGYSTIDHIHTLDQIVEKHLEFNEPLYLAYVDYAKAFDSISHQSIWRALSHQNVSNAYINIIKDIYKKSTSRVKLDRFGPKFSIRRGVKQGDPLSPKIFIAVLQDVMKDLEWSKKGIKIDTEYLSNLRFADDIVIFAKTSKELEIMIGELSNASKNIGLQMNTLKTKVATNSTQNPIKNNDTQIEYVDSYVYLGKQMSFRKSRHEDELDRRINMTWKKYWSFKEIMKAKLPLKLKKKVIDSCLLPCLSYGAQTWIFQNKTKIKIRSCQRAIERSILGIKLADRRRSEDIRRKTQIIDAGQHAQYLKWRWAGHLARITDRRWTKRVTEWMGPRGKRKKGRPKDRWADEIQKIAGNDWIRQAQNRKAWKQLEEAFTQNGDMS